MGVDYSGKIELGETEVKTCIREFKEENGMYIDDLKYKSIKENVKKKIIN